MRRLPFVVGFDVEAQSAASSQNTAISVVAQSCIHPFGQPSGGFFFVRDCFTASRQSPSILSVSGLGPGVARCFLGFLRLAVLGMGDYAFAGSAYMRRLPSAD